MYHVLGAAFKPYKDLISFHTWVLLSRISNLVVSPCTLPLQLHHLRKLSWLPFSLSSISLWHLELVPIWWNYISLLVKMYPHNQCLICGRSHMLRILPCIFLCFHLLYAWFCRSTWKTLQNSLQGSEPHPRDHSSWSIGTLRSYYPSIIFSWFLLHS